MELILGVVLATAIAYCYSHYKSRVYKRKVRPLSYFREMSDVALAATFEKIDLEPIRITSNELRGSLPNHVMVNQTLVEIINPSKLPDNWLGQFYEHLFTDARGNAPLWIDRVTLAAVTTNIKVAIQHTSNDRHFVIHFNPKQIRGDLMGSYLNIFFGVLEKK